MYKIEIKCILHIILLMEQQKVKEFNRLSHNWNIKWKNEQMLRHENWEMRRSWLDRQTTSYEENLYNRIKWEKEKKYREWTKYRLIIEKQLLSNMTTEEIKSLLTYINKINIQKRKDRIINYQ
jgi:hypothetical protein